jgi:spore coat protein CotH
VNGRCRSGITWRASPSVPLVTSARSRVSAATVGGILLALVLAITMSPSSTASPNSDVVARRSSDTVFDSSTVDDIAVRFAPADYEAMIATFQSTGDKDWIKATVTINGAKFKDAGMRLKGNSSLFGVRGGVNLPGGGGFVELPTGAPGATSADAPETLPWLIRLDEFVKGQRHDEGFTELVVRSNGSKTALNEGVALDLLGAVGLATQRATPARFRVNGGVEALRLVIENPSDEWDDANFVHDGILYKADSAGDYSYRGENPAAYEEVFEQETDTKHDNLRPLIEFLDFINNADDATFAAELGDHLDIQALADYLALQDLIGNFDDVDGPGNNSYLRYDKKTGRFTVVAWDHNLAFGVFPSLGPGGAGFPIPSGFLEGAARPGGLLNRPNVLVDRFEANPEFAALYAESTAALRASLYDSGKAARILDRRANVLRAKAADLVDASTIDADVAKIAAYFDRE